MRLSCFDYGVDFVFEENQVQVLVVENQQVYSRLIGTIVQQISGEESIWQFSDGDKELQISKSVSLVHSPFLLELNSNKSLNYLYKEMQTVANDFCSDSTGEINSSIVDYLDVIIQKLPYPVEFNLDLNVIDIFKLYDVHFDFQNSSLIEKVLNYIQLEKVLFGTKLIIFINMKDYFDNNEMQEIYKTAFYYKTPILLIESSQRDCLEEEKYCIIDKEKCLIEF